MKQKVEYPDDWDQIALRVKEKAGWKCIRCGHPHYPALGYTLTVHHRDGDPSNNEEKNLRALCQRCHLVEEHWVNKVHPNQGEFDFINKSNILQGGLI